MKMRSLFGLGISLAVLGAGSCLQVTASPRTEVNRRVQFPQGSTSIVIKGSVPVGKKDTYIFRVRKGQKITADVIWSGKRVDESDDQGLSGFTFVEPNGKSIPDSQNNIFNATSTGDYRVAIAQPYKMSSPRYTFKLSIR